VDGGLRRHSKSLIHTWKLRILKGLGFGGGEVVPVQEGEGLGDLSKLVLLVEDLLVGGFFDYLLVLIGNMVEGGLLKVVLNGQLVEDVIEILIKNFRGFLV
jgi:hypothetical protein